MECKDVLMGLAKHTIAFVSSSFDIGSDLVNGLNFFKPANETSSASNSSDSSGKTTDTTIGMVGVPSDDSDYQVHQIWGIMSLILMFLPGFIYCSPKMIHKICERDWRGAFMFMAASIFFPVLFICVQLYAIITTCLKIKVDQFISKLITSMTAAEAG